MQKSQYLYGMQHGQLQMCVHHSHLTIASGLIHFIMTDLGCDRAMSPQRLRIPSGVGNVGYPVRTRDMIRPPHSVKRQRPHGLRGCRGLSRAGYVRSLVTRRMCSPCWHAWWLVRMVETFSVSEHSQPRSSNLQHKRACRANFGSKTGLRRKRIALAYAGTGRGEVTSGGSLSCPTVSFPGRRRPDVTVAPFTPLPLPPRHRFALAEGCHAAHALR
eukprot:360335-Chlamydomonas_euryale.AAC.6